LHGSDVISDKNLEERVSELEARLDKVEGKTALSFDWKSEVGIVLGILILGLGFLVYQVYLV